MLEDESSLNSGQSTQPMGNRFRGFLPVVIDLETGGFNAKTDALLELAAVFLDLDEDGYLQPGEVLHYHVKPFEGANIEQAALDITGIKPDHPLRAAWDESDVLGRLYKSVRSQVQENQCTKAILVGHNAAFDLGFLRAATERCGIKRYPFHLFSTLDTVTLSGALLGQTVLARAIDAAGMDWDSSEAHSARYDASKTAELFCFLCNQVRDTHLSLVQT